MSIVSFALGDASFVVDGNTLTSTPAKAAET